MRAFLAILQLLLFSLPTFAPLAVAQTASDAHLPACCRRAGAHHCQMKAASGANLPATGRSEISARPQPCPYCPKALPANLHSAASLTPGALFFAQIVSHPACVAQTLAQRRIARDRARQKRGPPTLA